jgi:hypothetical protein
LQQALSLLDSTAIRRRATLLTDIGAVHAQIGNVQEACTFAGQALAINAQITRSLNTLQRIADVRDMLAPWKESEFVKEFDEQYAKTITSILRVRETI